MERPDFGTHVKQECELFGSLKDNLWHAVQDRVVLGDGRDHGTRCSYVDRINTLTAEAGPGAASEF